MALNSPKDLFLVELSAMYDAEKKIAEMLSQTASQVPDDNLTQMMTKHEQETRQQIANLDQCFQALGTQPQQVTCAAIDGMRTDFQQVIGMQPTPEVLCMFAIGAAMKVEMYETASYKGLVDKAMLMGETQCAQLLQTNLLQEEETAGKLERLSHDMSQRVLASA